MGIKKNGGKNRRVRVVRAILEALLVLVLLGGAPPAAQADMTLEEEAKLGKELYERLEKEGLIFREGRVQGYVNELGERLVGHAGPTPFTYTFSIIRSNAVNAFATPGGFVYLNQGLITLVESEGQLASVIAHEIAHINGRHVAENIARSKKIGTAALAGILAGMLLGGTSDAGAAVTGLSLAAATTLNLKYSREQEETADRTGASTLVKAGYSADDMLEFMKIMRRYEYYANHIPSYFLTHPGTDERMRYLDSLIQTTYSQPVASAPSGKLKRIQTLLRLNGLTPDSVNLQHFGSILANQPHDPDALLGLAVTQDKLGMSADSRQTFLRAMGLAPDDPDLLRAYGLFCFRLGQYREADTALTRVLRGNPRDHEALLALGRSLAAQSRLSEALTQYEKLEALDPENPELHYALAMAYGKISRPGDSHYYFGRHFQKKGKSETALFHFRAAGRHFAADSPRALEIAKHIEELSPGKGQGKAIDAPRIPLRH